MKRLWWAVCAAAQGLPYEEYIQRKRRILQLKIAELPDTPNFLTAVREYYGLKNSRRTWEVLRLALGLSLPGLLIVSLLPDYAHAGWGLLAGLWSSQLALFAVGLVVKQRYAERTGE